ncbi:MAG: hypothetical protein MJ118_08795, partial [Clostridia bacterium]|nr:hypothetical protein [Clostridia bacterium]
MKKRHFLIFFLILVLAVSLCPVTHAEGDLLFVAVNDTIPLTLSALPYDSGSGLYVPYTVFDAAPGGVNPAYNAAKQTFVLFTVNHRLLFDLAAGTVTDENQSVSEVSVIYRGGILYLPLVYCASHFGLRVTMLKSLSGYPILRFTTGGEVYDDSLFVEKAENLISYRAEQFSAGTQSDASADSTQGSSDPVSSKDPAEEEPEKIPVNVYLAFTNAEAMPEAMQALNQYRQKAAFFLTADEIKDNAELVRTLAISGHSIGLTVDADTADISAALSLANEQLDRVLNRKSVLVLLDETQVEGLDSYRIVLKNG